MLNLNVINQALSKDIKIKASAIDNLTDGRFFAAAGVEWIGFPADYSKNHSLTKVQILEIKEWLYGPRYVIETGKLGEDEINDLCQFTGIYNVQTARTLDPSELKDVHSIIREIVIRPETDCAELLASHQAEKSRIAQFVLKLEDACAQWSYWQKHQDDFAHLQAFIKSVPVILEMDYDQENVLHLIEKFQPFAISIRGSGEQEVGLKTFDEIADIFDCLDL